MKYTLVEPIFPGGDSFIKRLNEDGTESFIPAEEGNSDYLAYLAEQETAK